MGALQRELPLRSSAGAPPGPPHEGEVWSLLHLQRISRHSGEGRNPARAGGAKSKLPGYRRGDACCGGMPSPSRDAKTHPGFEGVARRKAQILMVPRSLRITAGASRRATCAHVASASALSRYVSADRGAPLSERMLICAVCPAPRTLRSRWPEADSARPNVSQLLAGTLSAPGGSPGTARVLGCEPNPRAPHPIPPHDAS